VENLGLHFGLQKASVSEMVRNLEKYLANKISQIKIIKC